jgi:hypothetical protein
MAAAKTKLLGYGDVPCTTVTLASPSHASITAMASLISPNRR